MTEHAISQPEITQLLSEFLATQSRLPWTTELAEDSRLIDLGVIDSIVVVSLVSFIEDTFSVLVPDGGIPIVRLEDLTTLAEWVRSLPPALSR